MRQSVISHSTGYSKIYNKVQLQLTRKVKVDCKKNSEHKREKRVKIETNLNCVQNISVYISNHTSNPKVCPFFIRRRDFFGHLRIIKFSASVSLSLSFWFRKASMWRSSVLCYRLLFFLRYHRSAGESIGTLPN